MSDPEKLTVRFLPDDINISVTKGDNLLKVAMKAGIHINASCGGAGVCGKCKVILEAGEVGQDGDEVLSMEDKEKGFVQACTSTVVTDLVIRIPPESIMDHKVLNRRQKESTGFRQAMPVDSLPSVKGHLPLFVKICLDIKEPTNMDNIDDVTRLLSTLKKEYGFENIRIGLRGIRDIARAFRDGNWRITVTINNGMPDVKWIVRVEAGDTTNDHLGIAVDVGTTTVGGELIDLNNGKKLAEYSEYNAQLSYGEDVITRIIYSQKPGGLKKMQALVVQTINSVISNLIKQSGMDISNVSGMTVAGNTTMTQLLGEIYPQYLREAPYVPTAREFPPVWATDLGIDVRKHVVLYAVPCVSSYVGGDIVAGILSSQISRQEPLTLYIDLGTNGEIVVGNKDWLTTASCSAGPAFEGGGIKFGMRATTGAIENVFINPSTHEPMIATISRKKAKGICGSGLINLVSELLSCCIIDQSGKFHRNLNTERVREGEEGYEYVLVWAGETAIDQDITITEADIDNLIRAKAAMFAGYLTLLESVGLSINDLDRIIIAGGFGNFINVNHAITLGLMPELPVEKYYFLGNGSLLGAHLCCLSEELLTDAHKLARGMTNIELSENPNFMDKYTASQFLPHTDGAIFSNTISQIECIKEQWENKEN